MKGIDSWRERSCADNSGGAGAPRMTGVGCYGKPLRIAQTLARVLARFGLKSADMLTVAWRLDLRQAGWDQQAPEDQRLMPGGEAVVMLSRDGRVTGFFLSAADDRPRLHVRIRRTRKDTETPEVLPPRGNTGRTAPGRL